MNVSNNFKDNIKEWISIDNNIMNIEDEIEPLKVKKNKLQKIKKDKENTILEYMKTNNITNNDIVLNDGKLKYYNSKSTEPISKKLVTEKINEYFKDNKLEGDKLLDYIFNNRDKKIIPVLKRVIQK
jgi:hypothetical protein